MKVTFATHRSFPFRRPQFGRVFAYRNFRLYAAGQACSLCGTWIQQVALGWLVYRLGGSAFLLGAISFSMQFPTFILSPFAGVMADRWDRHRALVITQSLAMVQAVVLMLLSFSEQIELWHLFGLSAWLGCVNAFDMPLRQSFVIEMVPQKETLPNAIAINSMIVNGARLIGPTIAGLLIAAGGEKICFLVNAVSFFAVLIALLAMRDLPQRAPRRQSSIVSGLKEGIRYAVTFRPILALLLLLSLTSISAMPVTVLMPVFAAEVFHGGPTTLGILSAASGCGALLSALHLAGRESVLGLGRHMSRCTLLYGAAMIAFSYTSTLWIALPLLALVGFGVMLTMAATNMLLQTIVEDDKRGRVMSLYIMAFMGTAPIGSLLAGGLSESLTAPAAVRILGGVSVLGGLLFARQLPTLREMVRPVYERAGILRPKEAGLQMATELIAPPEKS